MLKASRDENPFSAEMNDQSFARGGGGGCAGSGENNENHNMLMDS